MEEFISQFTEDYHLYRLIAEKLMIFLCGFMVVSGCIKANRAQTAPYWRMALLSRSIAYGLAIMAAITYEALALFHGGFVTEIMYLIWMGLIAYAILFYGWVSFSYNRWGTHNYFLVGRA